MYYPNNEVGDAFKFCQVLYRARKRDGVEFQFDTCVKAKQLSRRTRKPGPWDRGSR